MSLFRSLSRPRRAAELVAAFSRVIEFCGRGDSGDGTAQRHRHGHSLLHASSNQLGHWLASRLAGLVLLGIMAPLLAGCGSSGFKPLHGPTASGDDLGDKLAAVEIDKIPGRVGLQIRNELIFQTTGGNFPEAPRYSLAIVIREQVTSTLVQRTGESLGQVYNLDVNFELNDLESNKTILKGKSYGRAGFERYVSAYANVRARVDAEDRAAKTVAKEIKGRLAAFLATRT